MDNIVVNLRKGNAGYDRLELINEEGETYITQGLTKDVPSVILEDTFQKLIDYMLDSDEDEFNTEFQDEELEYAERIHDLIYGKNEIHLLNSNSQSETYKLTDSVRDNLASLVTPKTEFVKGSPLAYKGIDLIVEETVQGGHL